MILIPPYVRNKYRGDRERRTKLTGRQGEPPLAALDLDIGAPPEKDFDDVAVALARSAVKSKSVGPSWLVDQSSVFK